MGSSVAYWSPAGSPASPVQQARIKDNRHLSDFADPVGGEIAQSACRVERNTGPTLVADPVLVRLTRCFR